jgi:hypothetical protein
VSEKVVVRSPPVGVPGLPQAVCRIPGLTYDADQGLTDGRTGLGILRFLICKLFIINYVVGPEQSEVVKFVILSDPGSAPEIVLI